MLRRERVTERIADARPVALIVAPAGCGKSVALAEYLRTLREPHIRFDVRPEHGELLGFARGFAEAIEGIRPGAVSTVSEAVRSARAAASPGDLLAAWMKAHLGAFSGTMLVDDVHLAAVDGACADFLEKVISVTTPSIRWILAGRGTGRLPVDSWQRTGLATLAAAEPELRFTLEEARAAAQSFGASLQQIDVDALVNGTAGWAAALFMALRLQHHSHDLISALAAARELSYDYLAEQVYCSLTEAERRLLAVAALLPQVDVSVLAAAGFDDVGAMLDDLHRRLSVLAPAYGDSDAEVAGRYRCHDLFRDFLAHRVDLLDEAGRAATKLQAARALESCGQAVAALRLYAAAGDAAETLRLLETHVFELASNSHADTIAIALASLPPQYAASSAVQGARGHLAYLDGKYDEAIALLDRAILASQNQAFAAKLLLIWTVAMLRLQRNPIHRLQPAAGDDSLPRTVRAELVSLLLLAYTLHEPALAVAKLFDKAERLVEGSGSTATSQSRILSRLGKAASWRGMSERARRLLLRSADIATSTSAYWEQAIAYDGLSAEEFSGGNFPEALRYANLTSDAARKSGDMNHDIWELSQRIAVYFTAGMAAELTEAIARLQRILPAGSPDFALGSGEAMLAAWKADFTTAHRRQSQSCDSFYFWEGRMLAAARTSVYLAADGQNEAAADLARRAIAEAASADWARGTADRYYEVSLALCALAYAAIGDRPAARRTLRARAAPRTAVGSELLAIVAAVADGKSRASMDVHFRVLEQLWFGGYVKLVRAVLKKLDANRPDNGFFAPAELAVLRLLAAGATPKDVAMERECSVHTVRKHIAHISKKLECGSYRQAVRIARERGYLASS